MLVFRALCNPIQSWNALLVKETKGIGKSGHRIDRLRQRCNSSIAEQIVFWSHRGLWAHYMKLLPGIDS